MADNGEGTYYPTLISRCQRDWLECIQGVAYHDGMIWLACGLGNNPAHVYALNPKDGSIVVDVEIEESGELEGIGWAHSEADGWCAVIGQRYNNGWYRKITFSAK